MIRRIGIDFGTSTTVLRIKNYEDDASTPADANALACDAVKFSGMDTVPTLVREWTEGGARQSACGAKALSDRPGSVLRSGFKMELESPDEGRSREAWALTDAFFRYLYAAYREDCMNGSFGDSAAREETWVSHPVKWREETAQRLMQSAEAAGFQNVHRMNEAQAAVTSVALRNAAQLREKLQLAPGDRFRVLLVDMGAGTTDLVLGDYTYAADAAGARFETEVCWPAGGGQAGEESAGLTCGGREFDRRLTEHMQRVLRDSGVPGALPGGVEQVRTWKENDLSPSLAEDVTVSSFAPFEMYRQMTGMDIPFRLDRTAALELFRPQLCQLIDLVNGCIARAKEPYVDAVVLVGGGSQWFFVQDLMAGKLDVDGKFVFLARRDRTRPVILPVSRPQETVAQGLALAPLGHVTGEPEEPEEPEESAADRTPEPAPAAEGLWRRPEYAECLARFIVDFFNASNASPWKGKAYTEKVSALKDTAADILALLSRREPVRVCIRHKPLFLTGELTRADCNELAKKEEYEPPFPDSRETAWSRHLSLYMNFTSSADNNAERAVSIVRVNEEDYLLTEEQKKMVCDTMRRLGKRTAGMRRRDAVVGDGMDGIPEKEKAYKKVAPLPKDLGQVYYCHPHKTSHMLLVPSDVLVTDMGVFVLVVEFVTRFPKLYSWFAIAMTGCEDVRLHLRETECGEQLEEAFREIGDRLKKDFGMDVIDIDSSF